TQNPRQNPAAKRRRYYASAGSHEDRRSRTFGEFAALVEEQASKQPSALAWRAAAACAGRHELLCASIGSSLRTRARDKQMRTVAVKPLRIATWASGGLSADRRLGAGTFPRTQANDDLHRERASPNNRRTPTGVPSS
ncbi:MAG: hypothetical protein ABI182_03115, partial [Candidatus Baltobacteraceae bacterium]